MIKNCDYCNAEFNVKPSHYHLYFCCSRKCQNLRRKRNSEHKWKTLEIKKCKTCKLEKPISEYWKKLDKTTASCKECSSINKREQYAKNRDKKRIYSKKMYLKHKGKVIEYAKKWNKNNPKKRSKIMTFQNAKRRGRLKASVGIDLTNDYWKEIKSYFNDSCAYCKSKEKISVEHFYPISKGGKHCITNIIPACHLCNSRKNNQEPNMWVMQKFGYETLDIITDYLDNAAQILGWKVLRYTASNYQDLEKDLKELFKV